ncbi:hypothetical protein FPV67DRAFT_995840 [Lyophyllum atratum]|nr:hypothetical protein FPV67DRAFT_995840 [Lyophyllum atratum]
MYNWSPADGQVQQPYAHYPDSQHGADIRGYPYTSASPPSNNYYSPATQSYPTQQPPLPRHQSYPTHDPRLTVQQTNQTLTALASARRLSPEYIKESSNLSSPTRDYQGTRQRAYYDAQQPQQKQSHSGHGEPSESMYGSRPAQSPIIAASPPPVMNSPHQKSSDGHACGYCGKAFGRPSALKIHLAIHTGERAFVCPEAGCHRSFSVRSNMSRHIRNVHQIWPDGNQCDLDSGDEGDERRS